MEKDNSRKKTIGGQPNHISKLGKSHPFSESSQRTPMAKTLGESSSQSAVASKTVLITGVSKGLGRALALELSSRGHFIIGCSRDNSKLHSLQEDLSKSSPTITNHLLLNIDVTSDQNVQKLAQTVVEKDLVPDIIVNNAGVVNRQGKIWEVDVKDFDTVIDINLKGTANILRHFIPLMIPNKKGIIVNMSSDAGRNPYRLVSPYCASKWAIEGLSKSVAKELPEGMAIVALDPGLINTDMLASCVGDLASHKQSPEHWALRAATIILDVTTADNGASLTMKDPITSVNVE